VSGNDLSTTDMTTLSNNGFNLFSTAKYRIGNKQIESIDYAEIGTNVLNLVEFSDDYVQRVIYFSSEIPLIQQILVDSYMTHLTRLQN
jgi:hypothetical protein